MHKLINLDTNFEKYIIPENYLGSGKEAIVYAIDNDYVIRLVNTDKIGGQKFSYIEDIFDEDKNFGQPVAISEKGNITINRRVKGEPLYNNVYFTSKTFENDVSQINIYLKSLEEYSNLDDLTLENFIKDGVYLLSKGFILDPYNPYNYLYDSKNKKINIIDLCVNKKNTELTHVYYVYPLCYSTVILRYYEVMTVEERLKMFELIKQINNKIIKYSLKYNVTIGATQGLKMKNKCNLYNILRVIDDIDYNNGNLVRQIYQHLYPELYKELYQYT